MTEKTLLPKATHDGELNIGDSVIPCAVLEDGTRVLTQKGVLSSLGYSGGKPTGRRGEDGTGELPPFLHSKSIKPFISDDLMDTVRPLIFTPKQGGRPAHGFRAEILPMVCDVFLAARDAGVLLHNQQNIAQQCEILVRGLAKVGIAALVDEATGYQEVRDKEALQALLDKYLRKELAAWAKRFPDEFYKQMFRLKGWKWRGMSINRPSVVGKYTNDIVYERLAPGILEELQNRNPKDKKGVRKVKHHQFLTDDVGHPALAQHLYAVVALMRTCSTWDQFKRLIQKAFPKKGTTLELPFDVDSKK